jgi:hypothetical protein
MSAGSNRDVGTSVEVPDRAAAYGFRTLCPAATFRGKLVSDS